MPSQDAPITDSAAALALAQAARRTGAFALDLEFVSEDRYLPELALVQVGWGDVQDPEVAAIDPLEADPTALVELVGSEEIDTIVHSGQGDLTLLAREFEVRGRAIFDTQIAAAFLGIGDQIGYGKLVEALLDTELDKAMQFTRWLQRPLTEEQLRYALDDVRYLPRLAEMLRARLLERGRLTWVVEESDRLAEAAAHMPTPEEAYLKIGAWRRLPPKQLGALKALATWRERRALSGNRPPSWILKNGAVLSLAKRLPAKPGDLHGIDGLPPATRKRHGARLLEVIAEGAETPSSSPGTPLPSRLSKEAKKLGAAVSNTVQELCREVDIAPRFVANRSDCDSLVRWWLEGDRHREPNLSLLTGWRRQIAGEAALELLAKRSG